MKRKVKDILNQKKRSSEFVRIKRSFNVDRLSQIERGIVLDVSSNLVLLASVEDFRHIDTIVFPIRDIKKIRFNKSDKFFNKILHEEKTIFSSLKCDVQNWKSVCKSVKNDCVIIETENSTNRSFHIGGIVKISKKSIKLLYFDATGKLESKPYKIKFEDITRMVIESNYSTVMQKYIHK